MSLSGLAHSNEKLDASTVNSASFIGTSASALVQDWYDVHFLYLCSGMYNGHLASAGKDKSTVKCISQSAGWTFSLSKILASSDVQPLSAHSADAKLDTTAPLVLLAFGIAAMGLAMIFLAHGLVGTLAKRALEPNLIPLRIGYLSSIAGGVFLTNSFSHLTAAADRLTGTIYLSRGLEARAWMESEFYVIAWLGTAFMWMAVACGVTCAFMLSYSLKHRTCCATKEPSEEGKEMH